MGTHYKTCPRCGAHLDPGERCDCLDRVEETRAGGPDHAAARAYGPAIVGVDLAQGKDLTATAYLLTAQKRAPDA